MILPIINKGVFTKNKQIEPIINIYVNSNKIFALPNYVLRY